MSDNATMSKRPIPARPRLGWLAWEATLGYMSAYHSPDATLKLEAVYNRAMSWKASVVWGAQREAVEGKETIGIALGALWEMVNAHHIIFHAPEMAVKSPSGYGPDEWLDNRFEQALKRLIYVSGALFEDWSLIFVYRPIERADIRTQSRLIALAHAVSVGGNGPTLFDACVSLYHNAAPIFARYRKGEFIQQGDDDEPA